MKKFICTLLLITLSLSVYSNVFSHGNTNDGEHGLIQYHYSWTNYYFENGQFVTYTKGNWTLELEEAVVDEYIVITNIFHNGVLAYQSHVSSHSHR